MSDELVTVATSYDVVEAEFLRNHLEAEGFDVYLADENIVGAYNLLANAVGGIKIKVPSDDAEEAMAFVHDLQNAEIIGEEFEDIDAGYGECEKCGSRDQSVKREALGLKGILLFFGIPLVKPKRKLVCNECGAERVYE
ncbi:MAG: DUF2007 domain-containing protein [Actinomycetota bacterium]